MIEHRQFMNQMTITKVKSYFINITSITIFYKLIQPHPRGIINYHPQYLNYYLCIAINIILLDLKEIHSITNFFLTPLQLGGSVNINYVNGKGRKDQFSFLYSLIIN